MDKIELIKQEIEKYRKEGFQNKNRPECDYEPWYQQECVCLKLLSFIDQFGEEEETADLLAIAHLQGMEQMKQQMMKDAVEGEVFYNPYPTISIDDCRDYDFKEDQKVKLIIMKED